ncbi:hypothetical protein [Saccharothrix longispora]|uniref:hypothetical protein n=1 Tax=Saccharothrix longispora TaxID=33920 RepID=UPI0031EA3E66
MEVAARGNGASERAETPAGALAAWSPPRPATTAQPIPAARAVTTATATTAGRRTDPDHVRATCRFTLATRRFSRLSHFGAMNINPFLRIQIGGTTTPLSRLGHPASGEVLREPP